MLLKFSKTGEFLLQVGGRDVSKGNTDTESVHTATDIATYQGEIFVSDGYGNRRVVVFDAETGAFKRMWGAFGNEPLDEPPPEDLQRMEPGESGSPTRPAASFPVSRWKHRAPR